MEHTKKEELTNKFPFPFLLINQKKQQNWLSNDEIIGKY